MVTQPPLYCQVDAEPPASTTAIKEDVSPRNGTKEARRAPAQHSTDDRNNVHHELPSDPKATAAYISAAIATVAVADGSTSTAARATVDIISTYTADSVASAPTAKPQIAAAAIVIAITNHIAKLVANPGKRWISLCHLDNAVKRDIPDYKKAFVTLSAALPLYWALKENCREIM